MVHYEIQQSNQRIALVLNYLAGNYSNYRNSMNVPVDELTWAHAIIFSRSLELQVMGKPARVAPPYFDFFNHKMNVATNYALNDGNGSMVNGSIIVNLNINIKTGDEIQFEWAPWSSRHNGMNLALAGVVVPSCLAHSYELNASIASTDYKYDVKMKALQAAGLTDRGALNISLKNPLSPNLIKHFCVLSADRNGGYSDKDIQDMAFGRFAFTPAQVKNVYSNLITGCRNVLHAFHSAYSKDEKEFIQDFKLSRRARLAAQMRMEDKILMEAAIKAAKKAIEKLLVRRFLVIGLQVIEPFCLRRMTKTNEFFPRWRTDHMPSMTCDRANQVVACIYTSKSRSQMLRFGCCWQSPSSIVIVGYEHPPWAVRGLRQNYSVMQLYTNLPDQLLQRGLWVATHAPVEAAHHAVNARASQRAPRTNPVHNKAALDGGVPQKIAVRLGVCARMSSG
jgi:hypothetical protein